MFQYLMVNYAHNITPDTRTYKDFADLKSWRWAIYTAALPTVSIPCESLELMAEDPSNSENFLYSQEDTPIDRLAEDMASVIVSKYARADAEQIIATLTPDTISSLEAALDAVANDRAAARLAETGVNDEGLPDALPMIAFPGRDGATLLFGNK